MSLHKARHAVGACHIRIVIYVTTYAGGPHEFHQLGFLGVLKSGFGFLGVTVFTAFTESEFSTKHLEYHEHGAVHGEVKWHRRSGVRMRTVLRGGRKTWCISTF